MPGSQSSQLQGAERMQSAFAPALVTGGHTGGGGGNGSAFFPLLQDPAALHNEKERAYYMREEEKIYQTQAQMDKCQFITDQMVRFNWQTTKRWRALQRCDGNLGAE